MGTPLPMGAPKGIVSGTDRTSRPRGAPPPGKEWIKPYKRAQRKLDNAASLLVGSVWTVADAGCCADKPVKSTLKLIVAMKKVNVAAVKYNEAKAFLAEAAEAYEHAPPELRSEEAPELLELASERCETVEHYLYVAAREVILGHEQIYNGVQSGELVPEDPSELEELNRPRLRRRRVIRHNPLFVRAFLNSRRQRVTDRISPLLQRRRRTRLPAEVRVPKRSLRGRAPPVLSTCSL